MRLSIAIASSAVMFAVLAMASSANANAFAQEQPDFKDVEKNFRATGANAQNSLPPVSLRKRFFGAAFSRVLTAGATASRSAGSVLRKVPGHVKSVGSTAASKASSAGSTALNVARTATGVAKSTGSKVISTANGAFTVVKTKAGSAFSTAGNAAGKAAVTVKNAGSTVLSTAANSATAAKNVVFRGGSGAAAKGSEAAVKEGAGQAAKKGAEEAAKKGAEQAAKEGSEQVVKKAGMTKMDMVKVVAIGAPVGAAGVYVGSKILPSERPSQSKEDPQIIAFETPPQAVPDTLPAAVAPVGIATPAAVAPVGIVPPAP